jgi:hypothetical protein
VGKRNLEEDDAEEAALDEEKGAGFPHPHPLLLPLATKAGRKQRSKGEVHRKPPPDATHTRRSSNTPATSTTTGHRCPARPPHATMAGQRSRIADKNRAEEEASRPPII